MSPLIEAAPTSRRSIIVHFHFFKNAGSSVEFLLRDHFGEDFALYEHGLPTETFPATVLVPFLQKHERLQAISSHTICFPAPSHRDWSVFPVVFLRHPLDRVLSMYHYEKQQDSNNPGVQVARERGLAGYVEAALSETRSRSLRNYQAWMLAHGSEAPEDGSALLRAATGTLTRLPVVGVVDEFAESVRQFNEWLSPHFRDLDLQPVHRNRGIGTGSSMDERLRTFRARIGEDLFGRLERENAVDLELYGIARRRLLL
jgi:hypothetical protein